MPVFFDIKEKCAVCGEKSKQNVLLSISSFGPPDLDFRPSHPAREMLGLFVQICPGCDYCNVAISEKIPGAKRKIQEPYYKDLLEEPGMPEKARQFRCHAYLTLDTDKSDSFYSYIKSAWVCDDSGSRAQSDKCRRLAINIIEELKPTPESEEGFMEIAIHIDLLRRVGEFKSAKLKCNKLLKRNKIPSFLKDILVLQSELIRAQDMNVHQVP